MNQPAIMLDLAGGPAELLFDFAPGWSDVLPVAYVVGAARAVPTPLVAQAALRPQPTLARGALAQSYTVGQVKEL